jgi:hypothetical protein
VEKKILVERKKNDHIYLIDSPSIITTDGKKIIPIKKMVETYLRYLRRGGGSRSVANVSFIYVSMSHDIRLY